MTETEREQEKAATVAEALPRIREEELRRMHEHDAYYFARELNEARGKLEAVEPLLRRLRTAHEDRKGVCVTCCVPWPCMDAVGVDRILKERK